MNSVTMLLSLLVAAAGNPGCNGDGRFHDIVANQAPAHRCIAAQPVRIAPLPCADGTSAPVALRPACRIETSARAVK